jgi:hypothetical protein
LSFDILLANHTCASLLIFIFFITNDNWWPQWPLGPNKRPITNDGLSVN